MFGIEAELSDRPADGVCCCSICGRACPPIPAARVFERQMTAVFKKYRRLRELGIGDVACRVFFCKI